MQIDWKKIWETVKPRLYEIILIVIGGAIGVGGATLAPQTPVVVEVKTEGEVKSLTVK